MRVTKIAVTTLVGIVALGLSSCTATEKVVTETITVTASPTTTIAPATSAPVITAPTETLSTEELIAAGAYYISDERRQPLQEALVRIGNDWMGKMLTGEIPSHTRGWSKQAPAPYNGYGGLVSGAAGDKGIDTFIQVNVHFIDGQVDYSEAPLGIFYMRGDRSLSLDGLEPLAEATPDGAGIKVPDSPNASAWRASTFDTKTGSGTRENMYLVQIDNSDLPDSNLPLDRSKEYKVGGDGYKSVAQIKQADLKFLAELNSLNVTGSDWN
ncbi:hypothetical protein HY312_03935 [Candidatus Saccharibacteria bacterium]|nr:hypothetical protein [Candidatus Saccharibacteria bacterium]